MSQPLRTYRGKLRQALRRPKVTPVMMDLGPGEAPSYMVSGFPPDSRYGVDPAVAEELHNLLCLTDMWHNQGVGRVKAGSFNEPPVYKPGGRKRRISQ